MAELEAAIERLERAVARLETACERDRRGGDVDHAQLREIAARVDQALARIGRVLGEGEGE
jgi:exonuclease VII small subunit